MLSRPNTMFSVSHLDHVDSRKQTKQKLLHLFSHPWSCFWTHSIHVLLAFHLFSHTNHLHLHEEITMPYKTVHLTLGVLNSRIWEHAHDFSVAIFTTSWSSFSRCLDAWMQGSTPFSEYSEAYMLPIEIYWNVF